MRDDEQADIQPALQADEKGGGEQARRRPAKEEYIAYMQRKLGAEDQDGEGNTRQGLVWCAPHGRIAILRRNWSRSLRIGGA